MSDGGEQDSTRDRRISRLLGGAETGPEAILHQHSILCQTGPLPEPRQRRAELGAAQRRGTP